MRAKLSLVVHGPLSDEWTGRIAKDIKKFPNGFENIVFTSYAQNCDEYLRLLSRYKFNVPIKTVFSKDLLNPGFFNINRQILTVRAGIELIPADNVVIKLRNDQSVNFRKLLPYIQKLHKEQIITTNCFTRTDRLYHPSDMFLCGWQEDLLSFFSCPLMSETHLEVMMNAQKAYKKSGYTMSALKITPESYLFRNYLEQKGWDILETKEDSLNALRKYMMLVNSWNIGLRWKTKRTPFLPKGSVILPYFFQMRPFENGPKENCECMSQHEFYNRRPSLKDSFYLFVSKLIFSLRYRSDEWSTYQKIAKKYLPNPVYEYVKKIVKRRMSD